MSMRSQRLGYIDLRIAYPNWDPNTIFCVYGMNCLHFIDEETKTQRGDNLLKIPGLVCGLAGILMNVSLAPLISSFLHSRLIPQHSSTSIL